MSILFLGGASNTDFLIGFAQIRRRRQSEMWMRSIKLMEKMGDMKIKYEMSVELTADGVEENR